MANHKKTDEKEVVQEEILEEVTPVVEPAPAFAEVVTRNLRPLSLEQWASLKNIKPQHLGGMRAFIKNPSHPRSVEAWDKVFSTY